MKWINRLLKREFKYHVVYTCTNHEGLTGKGSIEIRVSKKIKSSMDVLDIKKYIEKENLFRDVVIENWIRLHK